MKFADPLIPGTLVKRYNRFLADIKLTDGSIVQAHCPNSGSMLSCKIPGNPVMVSRAVNPTRKTAYTWEMIKIGRSWVGINTNIPNKIAVEAIRTKKIPELTGYPDLRTEVKYGQNSRIDVLLNNHDRLCYVEVKNVTLNQEGIAYFPDAVTERGTKHLLELQEVVRQGHRGVMLYVVQRHDCKLFRPAHHIDSQYAQTLEKAYDTGVEILVYTARVSPKQISIAHPIPFTISTQ